MKRHFSLGMAALLALGSATAPAMANGPVFGAPQVSDPVCITGFSTVQQLSWLLRCQRTVPVALMAVTVAQAEGANCTPYRYWNYGPNVTTSVNRSRGTATIEYVCGHVEG